MDNSRPLITIYPGPCILGEVTPASLHSVDKTREAADTSYKSSAQLAQSQTPGVASDGGRGHRAPLGSYRPPQSGQPPASKVLPRHGLLASLGA